MTWDGYMGTPERARRELDRLHPDMIPGFDPAQGLVTQDRAQANYLRLSRDEQEKDTAPMEWYAGLCCACLMVCGSTGSNPEVIIREIRRIASFL